MAMAAPAVEATAATALRSVILRARKAAELVGRDPERVRVVAVSKTKPVSLIRQIYDAGHRCFGENYVQEFIDKAPQVLLYNPLSRNYLTIVSVVAVCCFFPRESIEARDSNL